MPKAQSIEQWIGSNVIVGNPDECWNATGCCYNKKEWHVAFKSNGCRWLAHRAAWTLANGPIPLGQFVLHKCDNPKCCNPSHLFLGTQSENALDMWSKGRARPGVNQKGIKKGPSTVRALGKDSVVNVFSLFLNGATQKEIASKFGITDVAVSCLLRGKTYPEFSKERECIAHLLGRGAKKRKSAMDDVVKTRAVYRRMTFQG